MARLAISKDYFPAYARLPRKAQRKADEFLRKFEQDSMAASIHLEPIKHAVDGQLRSARIGDDYRVILRAPEHGDVFLVLWADHHDEAYRWAETKQTAIHPATGSLQIFDVTGAAEAVSEVASSPAPAAKAATTRVAEPVGLFAARSDDDLFLAGVPQALMPSVRALVGDDDLDRLLPHLPPETGEVLTALAAGISLDEALEEVLGRVAAPAAAPTPPPIDVTDVPAALARDTTQRQFRLLDADFDLDAALKYPLDLWRVFLHPRQRKLAQSRTKGPTRVLGGAGTGKTVVALHRAAFLAREVFTRPDDRVLFTTFNVNLAHDLQAQLGKLLEPDQLARVEVVNIDSWASTYLRSRGVSVRPAFDKDQRQHFEAAYEVYGVDRYPLDFYRMEWREVIQEQGLRTEEEYVRAVRTSRGLPLGRAERRTLWPVFAAYRDNLEHAGLTEPLDILRRARTELEMAAAAPRYRSVVVDEAQDFAADGLRLVRAIAGPEHPDDLFLVGDAHQRIYGRPVALSRCGILVRGRRSQTLRVNYRTTGAICRWAMAILADVKVDDLDDGAADRRGYVSLREGPAPELHPRSTTADEERGVVAVVKAAIDEGTPAEAICVVARTRGPLEDRFGPALERAGLNVVLLEQEEPRQPGVRLATMHRVKGLEFAIVVMVAIGEHDIPHSTPELRSEDPVMSAQALQRERSLLYVAASRARDELHVFWAGEPSPFVTALAAQPQAVAARPAAAPIARARVAPPATPTPAPVPVVRRPAVGAPDPAAPPAQIALPIEAAPQAAAPSPAPMPSSAVAEPSTAPIDELAQVLSQPIASLALPTRMKNWAQRNGLIALGELARHAPGELLAQSNLGRTTVKHTRRFLETITGRRWEDLREAPFTQAIAVAPSPHMFATPWDAMRATLTSDQQALLLAAMPMPGRLRSYVEREHLVTLGDLAARTRAELIEAPNLGRSTIDSLPALISEYLADSAQARALVDEGLLECFRTLLEPLDPMLRLIATRRAGLAGEPMTLQELGDELGVSRERIRQLEVRLCDQLAHQPWTVEARRRIEAALAAGPVPFAILASDHWWTAASEQPSVVNFIVESVLELDASVIELDEAPWLSRIKAAAIAAKLSSLVDAAAKVKLPAPVEVLDGLAIEAAAGLGAHLATYFREELRGRLQISDSVPARVLAFGDTRRAELLALLRAAPEPVRVDDLQRQLGRRFGKLPDEVLHFGQGRIGLRRHFPDFEAWQAVLVPAAVRVIEELGPDRQWHCAELLDELREHHEIPTWMTPFGLAALIKAAPTALRYLGRLRVVLPGKHDRDRRIFVHDAIERLLQEAGEPVARSVLIERLDQRMGTSDSIGMILGNPPFVRVDLDHIGLLARDVPGGAAAIAEAGAHMEAVLARRGRGLSAFHVREELAQLSPAHATWSQALAMSVLRADGRFRLSQNGAVGLSQWDSTRVPTRFELFRSALAEADGHVSVEAVLARIEAHYGERPTRATLGGFAMSCGVGLDGEWITRKKGGEA